MASPYKSKEFKKLFDKWNKKLEESGFEDAEDFTLPEPTLKSWHSHKFMDVPKVQMEAAISHYSKAEQALDEIEFESKLHRKIWGMYADGMSVRQISAKVKTLKKSQIAEIIRRYKQWKTPRS